MNRKTVIAAALMTFALPFAAMAQAPAGDTQEPAKVEAPAKSEAKPEAKMEKSAKAKKAKKGVKKAAPRRNTTQSARPSESGTK